MPHGCRPVGIGVPTSVLVVGSMRTTVASVKFEIQTYPAATSVPHGAPLAWMRAIGWMVGVAGK